MAEHADFQRKQYAFAAHIRDPENVPAPGNIEDRRMAIYRELFFNNLFKLLSSTFPVLKKIHDDKKWRHLVRQFMIFHEAETPYFLQIPLEFLTFLQSDNLLAEDNFPFLIELAHYEWVELELSVSTEENDFRSIDSDGDLLAGIPVLSRLSKTLAYQYPVHRISLDYLPTEAPEQPTYLAVFRKSDDDLEFMELNPITARLLQLIEENQQRNSGRTLLLKLAAELNYESPEDLIPHGNEALQQMRQSEILLGTLTPTT